MPSHCVFAQLCQEVEALFDAFVFQVAQEACSKGARVVVPSDSSFRSTPSSIFSTEALAAHYNELKAELDQKFQLWNGAVHSSSLSVCAQFVSPPHVASLLFVSGLLCLAIFHFLVFTT